MRIPIPSVGAQVSQNGRFAAPRTVPQQNATGEQLANLGQAVQQVGAASSNIADYLQDQVDYAAEIEADNLTADVYRKGLHDPQTGYLNKIGRDANQDTRKATFDEIDKQLEQVGRGLQNEKQRAAWKRKATDRRLRAEAEADGHQAQQTHNYMIGVNEAAAISSRVDGDKDGMLAAVDELAKLHGEGDEQRDLRRLDATTQFHEIQVRAMVSQDPQKAATYLSQNSGEIAPLKREQLQQIVDRGRVANDAAKLALQLMLPDQAPIHKPLSERERPPRFQPDEAAPAPRTTVDAGGVELGMTTWNQTLADAGRAVEPPQEPQRPMSPRMSALQEEAAYLRRYADSRNQVNQWVLDGKIDADLASATLANLDANHRAHLQIRAERANQVANEAEKWLSDNPLSSVSQLPPSLHTEVEANGLLGQMNDFADNKRYTTDPTVFDDAMSTPDDVLRAMTPAMLRQRFKGRLDPRDWSLVQARHAKAFGQASKNDEAGLSRHDRKEEAFHKATGIKRGTLTDEDKQEKYRFLEHVQNLIDMEPADKELPVKRLQEILDKAVQDKAMLPRSFVFDFMRSDVAKPVYALTPDEQRSAYVPVGDESVFLNDIPTQYRMLAREELRRQGLPITEPSIARLWVSDGKPR